MLIVLGGLPGTGKTTIGKALAAARSAAYVRVDEIEQALRGQPQPGLEIGAAGYAVAQAIAASNLRIGNAVVADCVNPVRESRKAWREVARAAGRLLLEIELICSDRDEHRRRVESRAADIAGHRLPTWASVERHDYAPWTEPRLVIDTALLSPAEAVALIEAAIAALAGG